MKTRNALLLAALALSVTTLSGCASFGSNRVAHTSQANIASKLVRGVTTEAEVRQEFGVPTSTSFTGNGDAIWHYESSKFQESWQDFVPGLNYVAGGQKETDKVLTILFTQRGRVRNYSLTGGTHVDHAGMF